MEAMRNAYEILVGKPERKRPVARRRRRQDANIRMNIREVACENVDWIHLPRGRIHWRAVVNTAMNLRVLEKAGNFLTR
jgi:hypothetical protein